MKTALIVGIISVLGAGIGLANDLNFVLRNETGRTFEAIYLSAAEDKDWNANLLRDGKALPVGGTIELRFPKEATGSTWDLNIVDDAGLSVAFDDLDLEGVEVVTLKTDGETIRAEVK